MPSLGDDSTLTMTTISTLTLMISTLTTILISFFCFCNKFSTSPTSATNNNISDNNNTGIALDLQEWKNILNILKNNNGNFTTTTKYPSLVNPILVLRGILASFPSVSATCWCLLLGDVMVVFIPVITYFKWLILQGVSVVFIPAFIHFRIHF